MEIGENTELEIDKKIIDELIIRIKREYGTSDEARMVTNLLNAKAELIKAYAFRKIVDDGIFLNGNIT